jgi:hypothetical protein
MDGKSVALAEVVERKFKGDTVKLRILRDRKPMDLEITLDQPWPFTLHANAYDEKPRFVVFGGLVFQPVDENFFSAFQPDDMRLRYVFDFFVEDRLYVDRPEIVVLSSVLADPINAYASEFRFSIVDEINGKKIRRLDDVAEAFSQPADYYVIRMLGSGRPIVLERKAVEEARERILTRYGVRREQNLTK